jgi:benzil reductase ((S)-benzoin forming)
MTGSSLIWISGATGGIGLGLARNCPYDDARIINLSRRQHEEYETVLFDLADPSTWDVVSNSFAHELSGFDGKRAFFFQNAVMPLIPGFIGELEPDDHRRQLIADAVAPLILAEGFVRAVGRATGTFEAGLIMLSSAAAGIAFEGSAAYNAAKAAIEQWVRTVRRERALRDHRPWICAVRPGFVDTPGGRAGAANADANRYPVSLLVKAAFESGEGFDDIDTAARAIWGALPEGGPAKSVLLFGAPPKGAERSTSLA